MSDQVDDELVAAVDRACRRMVVVFASMADKLMTQNPSWSEIPHVLTAEEQAVFAALLTFLPEQAKGAEARLARLGSLGWCGCGQPLGHPVPNVDCSPVEQAKGAER